MRIFLLILFFSHLTAHSMSGDLKIIITGTKSKAGHILISIYNKSNGFPLKPFKVYRINKAKQTGAVYLKNITDLPSGEYAIALLDDTNNNGDMDYNFVGIPKEGYGFSNDAKPKMFSAPTFHDAKFNLGNGTKTIEINMQYW